MVNGSGDHDAIVPHLGTQAWVSSLGFPIVDGWRAWHLHGQSAGLVNLFSLLSVLTFDFSESGGSVFSFTVLQIHYKLFEQHDIRDGEGWQVNTIFCVCGARGC
jgi:hypothetical protein